MIKNRRKILIVNQKKISIITAILINVNIMVGAGIFISPPQSASVAGQWGFLGWTLAALILLPLVLCLSKLSALNPGAGGLYSYTRKVMGPHFGFLCGWIYFIGCVGAESLQMTVLRDLVIQELSLPWLAKNIWVFNAVVVGVVFLLSQFSMRVLGSIQSKVTLVKLSPIFFVLLMFVLSPFSEHHSEAIPLSDFDLSTIFKAVPFAIFGFWGFESCVNISHRIEGGKSAAAKAMLISFLLVTIIYTVFHYELLATMGSSALSTEKIQGYVRYLGWANLSVIKISAIFLSLAISISYFNAIFSEMSAYSFSLSSMAKAKDVFLPSPISWMNRNSQPSGAMVVNSLVLFLMITFITDEKEIIANANLGTLTAFVFALTSLIVMLWKQKEYAAICIPLLGYGSCALLSVYSVEVIGGFENALPFILLSSSGIVAYIFSKLLEKKHDSLS
jgi:amino acid transporter